MKKSYLPFLLIVFLLISCSGSGTGNGSVKESEISVVSPDKDLKFELFTTKDAVNYKVLYKNKEIILKSQLGFQISGKNILTGVKPGEVVKKSVNSLWKPVYGEKKEYPDVFNEVLIEFVSIADGKPVLKLRVRAFDEAVAFRYEFDRSNKTEIEKELTQFTFSEDPNIWVSERAQSEIYQTKISKLKKQKLERPLLARLNDSVFVALGEADLVDFARMKFVKDPGKENTLSASLDGKVVFDKPFKSPWRVIMAGSSSGELLEHNYIYLNLSQPNQIKNTAWIKPGKVIREVTLTTKGGKACVDFAAKHHLQFVEFDAGWYGNEYDKKSDASQVNVDPKRSPGPLDLHGIIDYAAKKGIGIILYVNQNALDTQIDKILPLYKKWGIKGVKYGFVNVGSQKATRWLHNAVKKAAENELMVDIHDEYRPTGFSRTYPNLMTQEGVRGDEESPDNHQVLKTLFTRMLAGAADHTNCYFAERVDKKMGSHVSQMAKAILIYSPWQFVFWYDRPEASPQKKGGAGNSTRVLREIPDLQFYDELPTVWEDTKVLEGEPGNFASIARKNGKNWFVGSLTDKEREVSIKFDFLDENAVYTAIIFQDDPNLKTLTKVSVKKIEVHKDTQLDFKLGNNQGLAIILKRKN
ncbi:MAG: alpha-glucosidase [Flavobacteriia bacterium]|nr:MAG: alpha-glucosidase [Flavobacteriia bacterium]